MASKKTRRSKQRETPRRPRGPSRPAGTSGEDGKIVVELGNVLARVAQELEGVQRTLRLQFTRMAELQAELDDVRAALKTAH